MSLGKQGKGTTTLGIVCLMLVAVVLTSVVPFVSVPATSSPSGEVFIVDDSIENVGETPCTGAKHSDIQSAIELASAGDTVRVCSGNYSGVEIDTREITLRATGEATVQKVGEYAFDILTDDVTIRGFDILGPDGGIRVRGERARILDNTITAAIDDADAVASQESSRGEVGHASMHGVAQSSLPPLHWTASHRRPGSQGVGIYVYADDALIRGNSIDNHGTGMVLWGAEDVVIRDNFVRDSIEDEPEDGIVVIGNASAIVAENTLTKNEDGIVASGDVTITDNNITRNANDGVDIGPRFNVDVPGKTARVRVVNNEILRNGEYAYGGHGILLRGGDWKQSDVLIRHNRVMQNSGFGIFNPGEPFNEPTIVNATRNNWGCGGPSSGLRDPYTQRIANGTGDEISAGDEPGVSNVHFDPFVERASCLTSGPTPSPTDDGSTPISTTTPTSRDTPATVEPTTSNRSATHTEATTGRGTTLGSGGGETGGDTNGFGDTTQGTDAVTATVLRTSNPPVTETPSPTPTLPPTSTPTPLEEPGFGVIAWVAGITLLGSLIALRCRSNSGKGQG